MSQHDQDDQDYDPTVGDDEQLEKSLREYGSKVLRPAGRGDVADRLENDPDFFHAMGKALADMAWLIAAAAVVDDDIEFGRTRKRILGEARNEEADLIELRRYYLVNRHQVDMTPVLVGPEAEKRLEQRLSEFLADFSQRHPEPVRLLPSE